MMRPSTMAYTDILHGPKSDFSLSRSQSSFSFFFFGSKFRVRVNHMISLSWKIKKNFHSIWTRGVKRGLAHVTILTQTSFWRSLGKLIFPWWLRPTWAQPILLKSPFKLFGVWASAETSGIWKEIENAVMDWVGPKAGWSWKQKPNLVLKSD